MIWPLTAGTLTSLHGRLEPSAFGVEVRVVVPEDLEALLG
jgi:hypothetical protein